MIRIKDIPRYEFVEKHQVKIKFVIVGIWNAIFLYLFYVGFYYIFNIIFSQKYMAYLSALVFSSILSIINSYVFHKYITFKSPKKGMKMVREFMRSLGVYLLTFLMGIVLLPFFVEIFYLDPKLAGALVIFITAIISYIGHSRFSFKFSDNSMTKVE